MFYNEIDEYGRNYGKKVFLFLFIHVSFLKILSNTINRMCDWDFP